MCIISTYQMKNVKILAGGIIIAIIVSISILATSQDYQNNTQPAIMDNPETGDMAGVSLNSNDSPTLNDSSSPQGQEFWIDDDGNKHYTITARDSPTLED